AFFQLPIAEEDIQKTCVTTPFGAFEFLRMNFGLSGAAQSFQRFIDNILRGLSSTSTDGTTRQLTIFCYVDDVLLASDNHEEHEQDLEVLFRRLAEYDLRLSIHKCEFAVSELNFLGHRLGGQGISPLPEKVSAIQDFPQPTNYKQLRRFLGMINFYHRFIPKAADILSPLNQLLTGYKKSTCLRQVDWTEKSLKSFNEAKSALANATLLHYPTASGEIAIFTDASDTAVGGVLQQFTDEAWVPLGFFSRKLDKKERCASAFARELLAIYLSIKHFHHWIEGTKLIIYTDHKSITDAIEKPLDRPSARESRQLSFISQYNPEIRHISGSDNIVADTLSRTHSTTVSSVKMNSINNELHFTSTEDLLKEQEADPELTSLLNPNSTYSLNIRLRNGVYRDCQREIVRIYLPASLRRRFFDSIHGLSHPGVKNTTRLVSERFVWPNLKKDIKEWVQSCHHCQVAKVHRHNRASIIRISNDVPKFSTIHIDLVGPLPVNRGCRYLLTMIDRFSRWPEVVPIPDITTETVCNAFLMHWVARFGVPETIVTDRGGQFEGHMFNKLMRVLGVRHTRTTAYHPQSNGLIERFHRSLKTALRSSEDHDWILRLPLVLLG
ncbi:MAG: RNase H-like domain-containing protein, partial [Bacteroidota bacterium]